MSSIGKLVRKSQASLFWCMQSLPKAQREAVYTLYAFCHHIDNIADGNLSDAEKMQLLNAWKTELDNIYIKKVPATDIGRKIYKNCMRFKIQKEDFGEILQSALLDFPNPLQAPDSETFYQYIKGMSEIPTYITLLIMGGISEEQMRELSKNYGRAMQLTMILRDIKEDAHAGHLYFPDQLLKKASISSKDPLQAVTDKNMIAVREQMAKEASEYFEKSFKILNELDRKKIRPLSFILHIYKRYFDIMQHRGWEIISPKPDIRKRDKIAIALKVLFDKQ